MTTTFLDVDVRPILRAGGEPFAKIMEALDSLELTEGLRLLATFKPVPLFGMMGSRGFTHEARELDGGEWEVLFRSVPLGEGDAPLSRRRLLPKTLGQCRRNISTTATSILLSHWPGSSRRSRP
jgi:hypothetical protein